MDKEQIRSQAAANKKANKKYFRKLKTKKLPQLDYLAQEIHDEVFERIDCLDCANCCKTTSPIFRDKDIDRLARHLRMRPAQFVEKYLRLDSESDYVLRQAPCPFLGPDNYCSVYEHRPRACRDYPHTDRKQFYQLLDLTLKNTAVCPAVLAFVDTLKERLPL